MADVDEVEKGKASQLEPEAIVIAQIAASIATGVIAAGRELDASDIVRQARVILSNARNQVFNRKH